jgi:hypothetical protein
MKYIEDNQKQEIKNILELRHMPVTESGCWLWDGSATKQGYGDFRYKNKHYLAHQASYMAYNGNIDNELHVMHICDVRLCCNPNHLTLGTNYDNILDSVKKGRRKRLNAKRPKSLVYKKYSNELIKKAVDFYLTNKLSYAKVSKMFDMPHSTLAMYVRKYAK